MRWTRRDVGLCAGAEREHYLRRISDGLRWDDRLPGAHGARVAQSALLLQRLVRKYGGADRSDTRVQPLNFRCHCRTHAAQRQSTPQQWCALRFEPMHKFTLRCGYCELKISNFPIKLLLITLKAIMLGESSKIGRREKSAVASLLLLSLIYVVTYIPVSIFWVCIFAFYYHLR